MKNIFWILISTDSLILIFIRVPLLVLSEDAAGKAKEGAMIFSMMLLIGISISLSFANESPVYPFLGTALAACPPLIIVLMRIQKIGRKIQ